MDAMVDMSDSDALITTPPKKKNKTSDARKHIERSPQTNFNRLMGEYLKVATRQEENSQEISSILTNPSTTSASMQIQQKQRISLQQPQMSIPKQPIFIYKSDNNHTGASYTTNIINNDNNFQNHEETTFTVNDIIQQPQQSVAIDDNQLTLLLANQKSLLTNQEILKSNHMKIIEQLAKNNTMIDLLLTRLNKNNSPSSENKPDRSNDNLLINDLLPVDSFIKIENLESALTSETFIQQLVEKKSAICGNSGKMNGINCCYTLIDNFFTREFLTNFSWGGGSRDISGKSRFKNYKNIRKAFHMIIRKDDLDFSELSCENFFKSIVKNAKRRASLLDLGQKKCRASQGKRRPNLIYNKNTKATDNVAVDNNEELEQEVILQEMSSHEIEPEVK